MNTPTLLGIPLELRLRIFREVIDDEIEFKPPDAAREAKYYSLYEPCPKNPKLPLLLVNRQISAEAQEIPNTLRIAKLTGLYPFLRWACGSPAKYKAILSGVRVSSRPDLNPWGKTMQELDFIAGGRENRFLQQLRMDWRSVEFVKKKWRRYKWGTGWKQCFDFEFKVSRPKGQMLDGEAETFVDCDRQIEMVQIEMV
jgi:hypothetical protein